MRQDKRNMTEKMLNPVPVELADLESIRGGAGQPDIKFQEYGGAPASTQQRERALGSMGTTLADPGYIPLSPGDRLTPNH